MHSEKNNGNENNIIFSIKRVFLIIYSLLFFIHLQYADISWHITEFEKTQKNMEIKLKREYVKRCVMKSDTN